MINNIESTWFRWNRLTVSFLFIFLGLFVANVPIAANNMVELQQSIHDMIPPSFEEKICLSVTNLLTGKSIGIHDEMAVNPASVIKIAVMVEAYIQASHKKISFEDILILKKNHKVPGAGSFYYQPIGSKCSIRQLVYGMIHDSDNTATKMLIEHLGKNRINASMKQLGLTHTVIGTSNLLKAQGLNFSTPRDMNRLLSCICYGKIVSRPACSEMVSLLSNQRYRWGIPKYIPKDIVVANKTGTLNGIKHDSGIVFLPNSPYAITIFTHDVSSVQSAMSLISKISERTYEWSKNHE